MTQFEDSALVADASGQMADENHHSVAARNLIAGKPAGDGQKARENHGVSAVTTPIPAKAGRQATHLAEPNSFTPADQSATAGSAAPSPAVPNHHTQHSEDAGKPAGEARTQAKPRSGTPRHPNAGKPARQATQLAQPMMMMPDATNPAQPGGAGHGRNEAHLQVASTARTDGHCYRESHHKSAVKGDSEGQIASETQPSIADTIAQLIQLTRMRRRWHKAEKSLTLQGKAMARAWFAGDKDEANKAFTLVEKGGCKDVSLVMAVTPFLMAREPFEIERAAIEKTMRKLARSLPVWQWAEGVKGLGDLRLAIIVGECGDIGSYKSVSAVWKRMGLAVIDGGRQRRVAGDAALEHGYNPERRAIAYVMGTEILKAQVRNVKDDDGKRTDESRAIGPYGEVYLERKAYEAGREGITKSHANNRAARYMVKRVLRDLYGAWRQP